MTVTSATLELPLNLHQQGQNLQLLSYYRRPIACEILHAIPGRIRLRIPKLAQESTYGEKLTYVIESLPWVSQIRINPLVSCVIINYQSHPYSDPQKQATLLERVQEADTLILLPTEISNDPESALVQFWEWLSEEFQSLLTEFAEIRKTILVVIAIASLILGIAGLILPLLPGIPFLVLSHLCFLGCS